MLTPEELRNLPEEVVSIIELCEDDILKDIGRRISETGKLTPTAINQLTIRKNATLLRKDVTKTLAKYSGLTEKAVQSLLINAGVKSIEHEDEMLPTEKRGRKSKKLENIIRSNVTAVNGTMANMTKGTAREVSKRYTDAINRALVNIKSGAFSYEHEIRRACDSLADSMTYVKRSDGKYETLEVAVRRAVRTGLSVMAGQLAMQYCKDIGAEYVEVSAHEGARTGSKLHDPSNHAWWQGRVFHIGGDCWHKKKKYLDFVTNTGYGTGEGLCGWNCRHSFHAFFPDSMKPAYDYKALRKLNAKNISYNGKKYSKYEIDQMQRYRERQVRKYKRRYEIEGAAGLDTSRSRAKLREWQEELRRFTEATGNKREYAREYVAVRNDPFGNLPRISGEHSIEADLDIVNLAYRDEEELHNCLNCVLAFELRRRGYDVVAKNNVVTENDWLNFFETDEIVRSDMIGEIAEFQSDNIAMVVRDWGAGSRGIIRVRQEETHLPTGRILTNDHVFIVYCDDNGNVHFGDPQIGPVYQDCFKPFVGIFYKSRTIGEQTIVFRVDNCSMTGDILRYVESKKK